MSLAVSRPPRAPLQRLHEIGKMLMRFDRLEEVLPRVLFLAAEDPLLSTAVLITTAEGAGRPFVWRAAHVTAPSLRDAVDRARVAFEAVSQRPGAPRMDQEPGFSAFALLGPMSEALGSLALEWSCPPDAERLAFGESLSELLALAMDRHARARRATRCRDDRLADVSHELKNLLAALRANLEMLQRTADQVEDEQPRGQVRRMQRATDRMGRLIQDLLDVGSVEARALSMCRQRLDVPAMLVEALEAAAPVAARRSIQLRSEVAPGVPEVMADALRLQQVFANLLSNAIKFSHEGGAITVRAEPSPEGVTFSVQDHGDGIEEEDRPHVFERFWQGTGRHVAGQGFGLGLYIVEGIVRAHGGRIWVASEVGHGATFFFTIPAAAERTECAQRPEPAPRP